MRFLAFLLLFIFSIVSDAQEKSIVTTTPFLIEFKKAEKSKNFNQFLQSIGIDESSLKVINSSDPAQTRYKKTFQQYYAGIKVEHALVSVHYYNDSPLRVSGHYYKISDLRTTPDIDEDAARDKLMIHLSEKFPDHRFLGEQIKPELLILIRQSDSSDEAYLAYKFQIQTDHPLINGTVYISATDGEILSHEASIHLQYAQKNALDLYGDTVMIYTTRVDSSDIMTTDEIITRSLGGSYDISEAADISCTLVYCEDHKTAVQAHYGAQKTTEYFELFHGRLSFDGLGSTVRSYVHFGNKFNNAFWDGHAIYYGDGDGYNLGPVVDLDISGHEYTHGVIDHTANLRYQGESGAINESYADIFGEMVEFYATDSNDWLLGSRTALRDIASLRSMKDPKSHHNPDTYKGQYWNEMSCNSGNYIDYGCGIHINSGVHNKWFYILSMGDSGINDNGDSYDVEGIGREKAAQIAYYSLNTYLTPQARFKDARIGSIQAAIDLYGMDSEEEIAVTNAWYAVGVGEPYVKANQSYNTEYIIASESISTRGFVLSWPSAPTEDAVYQVFLNDQLYGSSNTPEIAVTNLTPDTKYKVMVVSISETDTIDYEMLFVKTLPLIHQELISLSVDSVDYNNAWISWERDTSISFYYIFLDDLFYGSSLHNQTIINNLNKNQSYNCWLLGYTAQGQLRYSDTVYFNTITDVVAQSELIFESYFEEGWDNWIPTGTKAEWYGGIRSPEGVGSVRLKGGKASEAMMISPDIRMTGNSDLTVRLAFYSWSMEIGEAFSIEYFVGDGWRLLDELTAYYDFDNNSTYWKDYRIKTGSPYIKFRITNLANASTDHVYIDGFSVSKDISSLYDGFLSFETDSNDSEPWVLLKSNPISGVNLTFTLSHPSSRIEIVDTQGKVILTQRNTQLVHTMPVSGLRSGLYYLRIIFDDHYVTKAFIKE